MAAVDQTTRLRHAQLLAQQKRLRHLHSITARNLRLSQEDARTAELYFTLHVNRKSPAIYTSEKIKSSVNPTWRTFDIEQLCVENRVNTSQTSFVVQVWQGAENQFKCTIDWQVDITGLVYLGDKVQKEGIAYDPNTLIFGIREGYYGAASDKLPIPPLVWRTVVDQASLRDSYTASSLNRIQTVLRAIKQTQIVVDRVRGSIEESLSKSRSRTEKHGECEKRRVAMILAQADLEWRCKKLQAEKESYEQLQAHNHQRDVTLRNKQETLMKDRLRLHEKKKSFIAVREEYVKASYQLSLRRKQLISELAYIYPIEELQTGEHTICGVRLPNSEDFQGHDEIMVAVSLGYTTHLVQMIAQFLDVPLRYPMEYRGSRSQIRDHIHDKLTDKERDFPLYSKGKERFQFNYGVYLLNKNIAQLRYYCGLGTTDLRMTLTNLKTLLELRLGVKFDGTNRAVLSSAPQPIVLASPPKRLLSKNSKSPDQNWVILQKPETDATKEEFQEKSEKDQQVLHGKSNVNEPPDIAVDSTAANGFDETVYKGTQDAIFQLRNSAEADCLERSRDSSLDRMDIIYNSKFGGSDSYQRAYSVDSDLCDKSDENAKLDVNAASAPEAAGESVPQYQESGSATFKQTFKLFAPNSSYRGDSHKDNESHNTSNIPKYETCVEEASVNHHTFKTDAFYVKTDSENMSGSSRGLLDDQIPGESPPWGNKLTPETIQDNAMMNTDPASAEYQNISERTSMLGNPSFKFVSKDHT